MSRVYLDHNATAPLLAEAREAMVAAMDLLGNPSSVHMEGRAAKGLMEKARAQVAEAAGVGSGDVVFTSGATEGAALGLAGREAFCSEIEHDCVWTHAEAALAVDAAGRVTPGAPERTALQQANSETGILQDVPEGVLFTDAVQAFGKVPFGFEWSGASMAILSAHKVGGPKGVGALLVRQGFDVAAQITGGGQEMGRRSGTENLIGIAGFGAAAEVSARMLADGTWERVAELRNILENGLEAAAPETIFVGKGARRLPNTSCFVTTGWKGETQVMAMDLAGFAVSAGSACSSGKVKSSRVLRAMGFSEEDAGCALRVSLGPETKEEDVLRFVDVWTDKLKRHRARAA